MLNTAAGKELKKHLPENFTEDFYLIRALTHRSYSTKVVTYLRTMKGSSSWATQS